MIYLPAIFIFFAGACNGIMDLLQFHFGESKFKGRDDNYWNPSKSHVNKWKDGYKSQGEKFWGSSRWFVMFTDGWHRMKHRMIMGIVLAVFTVPFLSDELMYAYYNNEFNFVFSAIVTACAWWLGFWLTYESSLLRYDK